MLTYSTSSIRKHAVYSRRDETTHDVMLAAVQACSYITPRWQNGCRLERPCRPTAKPRAAIWPLSNNVYTLQTLTSRGKKKSRGPTTEHTYLVPVKKKLSCRRKSVQCFTHIRHALCKIIHQQSVKCRVTNAYDVSNQPSLLLLVSCLVYRP